MNPIEKLFITLSLKSLKSALQSAKVYKDIIQPVWVIYQEWQAPILTGVVKSSGVRRQWQGLLSLLKNGNL
jgi:hypothetical protein